MDKPPLVEAQIDEGQRLLDLLNDSGFPMDVAFWMFTTESTHWGLYIASEVVEKLGGIEAFRQIYDATRKLPHSPWFSFFDVVAVAPAHPAVQAVESFISEYPDAPPLRIEGVYRNGVYFVDLYIYPKFESAHVPTRH